MTEEEYVNQYIILEARWNLAEKYKRRQPKLAVSQEKEIVKEFTALIYCEVDWKTPIR